MNVSAQFVVCLTMIVGALASPLAARAQDETQPTFVKGKFDLPLDHEVVKQEWKGLGYFRCAFEGREKGWTSELPERQKGEHTHPSYILFAGIAGKMEFIINDQRFVLEPGDELFYPKDAVMAARNLYDGRSQWFECWKSQ